VGRIEHTFLFEEDRPRTEEEVVWGMHLSHHTGMLMRGAAKVVEVGGRPTETRWRHKKMPHMVKGQVSRQGIRCGIAARVGALRGLQTVAPA
jgi:hypothetical protein